MLITLLFLCFPAYLVAQICALWRLRGGWRLASVMPAAGMVLVVASALISFYEESPQWPLLLLFLSPLALAFTLFLLVAHWQVQRENKSRPN